MSGIGYCPCDTREPHPISECTVPGQSNDEVYLRDVMDLCAALGLGTHARPYSAHAVIHREILPALRKVRDLADRCDLAADALDLRANRYLKSGSQALSHYRLADRAAERREVADEIRTALGQDGTR